MVNEKPIRSISHGIWHCNCALVHNVLVKQHFLLREMWLLSLQNSIKLAQQLCMIYIRDHFGFYQVIDVNDTVYIPIHCGHDFVDRQTHPGLVRLRFTRTIHCFDLVSDVLRWINVSSMFTKRCKKCLSRGWTSPSTTSKWSEGRVGWRLKVALAESSVPNMYAKCNVR